MAWAVSGGVPLSQRLGHFFRGAGITILEGWVVVPGRARPGFRNYRRRAGRGRRAASLPADVWPACSGP